MSDLADIFRHIFERFGKPQPAPPLPHANDETVVKLDARIHVVEARLKRLERASDPRDRLGRD